MGGVSPSDYLKIASFLSRNQSHDIFGMQNNKTDRFRANIKIIIQNIMENGEKVKICLRTKQGTFL